MEKDLRLYILMRDDMDSLNSGKAMAQAAHAANQYAHDTTITEDYGSWKNQGRGFGTTITLGMNWYNVKKVVDECQNLGLDADVVLDETYPIQDGEVVHLISIHTCGYVFLDVNNNMLAHRLLSRYELHP